MNTLIAISAKHAQIIAELMESGGEVTPEQEAALAMMVEKVDACALFLKRLHTEAEFFRSQAEMYLDTAKRLESKSKWLEAYIKSVAQKSPGGELVGETTKFVLQNNPPKVTVDDEAQVPADYFTTEIITKLDKRRVLDELKKGAEIPGCRLERDQRLVTKANSVLINARKESAS